MPGAFKLLAALGAVGACLSVTGCASLKPAALSGSAKLVTDGRITIGYTAIGAAYADLYVCQDAGVFKRNGLDVKLTTLNTSSQLLAALSSDSVQIGVGAATSTAVGILKGIDLRYIANPAPKYYLEMWGDTDIRGPQDLVGKSVAVSSPGSLSDEAVKTMLADEHLEGKVEVKYLKSIPAEVTALQQGSVDAIATQPPNSTKTRKFGAHKIMDFTRYPAATNVYTITKAFRERNPDVVRRFVKSEVECLSILHQDRAQAISSIRKHSGTDDEALANYAYDFFQRVWNRDARVDPELIHEAFERAAAKQQGTVPEDWRSSIDSKYDDELVRSGYVSSLYRTPQR